MKLFGHKDSGHAFKVKFFLQAAGIKHDYEVMDIFSKPTTRKADFLKHSKFCEVPLLLDQGKHFIQSNAILIYLAKKYNIYGAQNEEILQKSIEWLVWEANKIGMCLPQLRADVKFGDIDGFKLKKDAREWLMARFTHDVGALNTELSDGRSYIIGDEPTIADFSLCAYLIYVDGADVTVPDYVKSWLLRLSQLEGFSNPYEMLS